MRLSGAADGTADPARWAERRRQCQILDRAGDESGLALRLPHPRLSQRAFVLLPLAEIAPLWRHPENRRHIDDLIADLPEGQKIERLET